MPKKIAINGFGRIGKTFLRTVLLDQQAKKQLDIVAINIGPSSCQGIDHNLKYDSIMGTFPAKISYQNNTLTIDDYKIKILTEQNPTQLPWEFFNVDWVIEASGIFTSKETASLHVQAGCKKVLITAPAQNEDITIIPGVNDSSYDSQKHNIISLGSCTTNCFAPIIKVLTENFDLCQGLMTTIHAYTNDQVLLDSKHEDPRRSRAASLNIIPTKTGAEKTIIKIYPELKGKLKATAIRVPVPIVSLIDFTFTTKQQLDKETVNNMFKDSAEKSLKNILLYTTEPLVSSDYISSPYSCIIDGPLTQTQDCMGKIFGWYDNEYGYSSRLKDFLLHN